VLSGTGIELIKIGTKIPPPVQAIIMFTNLKAKGVSPRALKTLDPVKIEIKVSAISRQIF
jgi:hypothetical protein